MAKQVIAYADAQGKLHPTREKATVSDLTALFGSEEGMAHGIATTVLANRHKIEQIFRDHDATGQD